MKEILFPIKPEQYGPDYYNHRLEIYKLYVEMADRVSERRHSTNSFFFSIHTAILGLTSYIDKHLIISMAGIILSYVWYRGILTYKIHNSAKFKVINNIEAALPLAVYNAEWQILSEQRNKNIYKPFHEIEIYVPFIFMLINFVAFIFAVLAL